MEPGGSEEPTSAPAPDPVDRAIDPAIDPAVDPAVDPEIGHVWRRATPPPGPPAGAPTPSPAGRQIPAVIVVAIAFLVLVVLAGGVLVGTGTWPPEEKTASTVFIGPGGGSTTAPASPGSTAAPRDATSATAPTATTVVGAGTTTTTRPRRSGPIGPFGSEEAVRGRPMLSPTTLVLFTDSEVIAEDPSNEAVRWRAPCTGAEAADSHQLAFADSLLVRCREQVLSLAAADGSVQWRTPAATGDENDVFVRDDVVVIGEQHGLRVVDRATGEERFRHYLGGYDDWLLGAQAGKVFFANEGELVAIDTLHGQEVFRVELDVFRLETSPDVLIAGLADGSLAAIDPPTGALRWQAPPSEAMHRASIEWIAGSRVVLHRDDGTFDGYDTGSGALVWSGTGDIAYEGVRYDGNRILAYDGDNLRVVDVDSGAVLLEEAGKLRAYVAAGGTLVTLGSSGAVVRPLP